MAGHVGLELANVILKKPLKCWANSHGLRNILGPETFRVRAAADQVPEPVGEVAVSTLGDTWQLGRHRLLCGNALELRAIATKGPGKNETPKSGLRDQEPDRRFRSLNPDTETKAYPRNAAIRAVLTGFRVRAGRDRTGWLERTYRCSRPIHRESHKPARLHRETRSVEDRSQRRLGDAERDDRP